MRDDTCDKELTNDAMRNPQVGMRFTEMYNYFVCIVWREDDWIVYIRQQAGEQTTPHVVTVSEFVRKYSYDGKGEKCYMRLIATDWSNQTWMAFDWPSHVAREQAKRVRGVYAYV